MECGVLMYEITALIKETPEISFSVFFHARIPDLRLATSRTVGNKFLLLISHSTYYSSPN